MRASSDRRQPPTHLEGNLEHDQRKRRAPVIEGRRDHALSVLVSAKEEQGGKREEGALEKSLQQRRQGFCLHGPEKKTTWGNPLSLLYELANEKGTDWLLSRGSIVDRTYGTHKHLYIYLFLLTMFGPI